MGTLQTWRKAYGAIKDHTKVGLAHVNSDFKVSFFIFPFEGLGDLLFLGFYLVDVLRMRIIFDGFFFPLFDECVCGIRFF